MLGSLGGSEFGAFVVLLGTDTLEEAAFLLHLMLATALGRAGKPLVITGGAWEPGGPALVCCGLCWC